MPQNARKIRFRFNAKRLEPYARGEEVRRLQALLARYRYLRVPHCPGHFDEATRRAVAQYQSYYRVDVDADGVVDPAARLPRGARARPMEPDWATDLRDQYRQAEVPFFFKQWGGKNKKQAGRVLDGRTWDQMPNATIPHGVDQPL